jgi:hypothetical protein
MIIPRTWKISDRAAAVCEFLEQKPPRKAAVRDLIRELTGPDPFARRCAAELARRVSEREPGILRSHTALFIDLALELPDSEWQTTGHLALAAALNATTHTQRRQMAVLLQPMAEGKRLGLRAIALEAFAILAADDPALRNEAMLLLERAREDPSYAMRVRARRMVPVVLAAEERERKPLI